MRSGAIAVLVVATGCLTDLPPCTDGVCGMVGEGSAADGASADTLDDASTTMGDDTPTGSDTGAPAFPCGDRITQGDETCDDGNLLDGDGCNADCQPSLRILDDNRFGGMMGGHDTGFGIGAAEPGHDLGALEGLVVLGGTIEAPDGSKGVVRGLGPDLEQIWAETLDFPVTQSRVLDVVVEETGESSVVGTIGTGTDLRAVAAYYFADGSQHWSDTVGAGATLDAVADAQSVAVDNFGNVFVGGFIDQAGVEVPRLARYAPQGPPEQWDESLVVPMGSQEVIRGLAVAPTGAIVFVGQRIAPEGSYGLVGVYDETMTNAIETTYGTHAIANGVVLNLAGDQIVVVGSRADSTVAWAAAYDLTLLNLWSREFSGIVGGIHDIAVAPDGSYYVTGHADSDETSDLFVAHLAANGAPLYQTTHDLGGGQDSGRAIAYDTNDDTLLVTGERQVSAADYDIFVARLAR